jgi:hypothetical protein
LPGAVKKEGLIVFPDSLNRRVSPSVTYAQKMQANEHRQQGIMTIERSIPGFKDFKLTQNFSSIVTVSAVSRKITFAFPLFSFSVTRG